MFDILDPICTPQRATKYSAAIDLFARKNIEIAAGETKIIPLGVKINLIDLKFIWNIETDNIKDRGTWEEFLKSHYLQLNIRSSLALKGLIIPNGLGVIDLDYPNEIGLILHNPIKSLSLGGDKEQTITIRRGQKVAQCMIMPHKSYLTGFDSEGIRTGGFGSTGE